MEGVYTGKGRLGEAELGEVVVNAPLKKMAPTSHVINPWCDFTPKLEPVLRQKPNDFSRAAWHCKPCRTPAQKTLCIFL